MHLKITNNKVFIVFQGVVSNPEQYKEITSKFPPKEYVYQPTGKVLCHTCEEAKECIELDFFGEKYNICVECYNEFVQARKKVDELRGDC